MSALKVSIITPSFNQARFLPDTLRSVRAQDYPNIEHIVVDGGSTDGTIELLKAAPGIRWISEPDRGQVDALNKGFAMATGEILAWLNSDDVMNPDTVRVAADTLQRTGADLVYGDVEIVDEVGRPLRTSCGIPFDLRVLLYGINYIGQQTVFFRRELLQKAGPLREEFDSGFDYELWLRFSRHGRFAYEPRLRAKIRVHPAAKSVANPAVGRADTMRIVREYWAMGGLHGFLQHLPLRTTVRSYYRLKRQWRRRIGTDHA
jgi:glycosyltransferase involved in cell wall biosynthesis